MYNQWLAGVEVRPNTRRARGVGIRSLVCDYAASKVDIVDNRVRAMPCCDPAIRSSKILFVL